MHSGPKKDIQAAKVSEYLRISHRHFFFNQLFLLEYFFVGQKMTNLLQATLPCALEADHHIPSTKLSTANVDN